MPLFGPVPVGSYVRPRTRPPAGFVPTPQTVTLGQASETDTAQAVTLTGGLLLVDYDDGTDGATIAASGDIASVNGTPTYTSDAKHGGMAERGTGTAAAVRILTLSSGDQSGSVYVKANGITTGACRFVEFDTSTGAIIGSIRMHSDGHFDVANNTSSRQQATTLSWAADTWYRVDWQYVQSTALLTARVFTAVEGSTPAETISGTINTTVMNRWQVGALGGAAGQTVTVDTFRAKDSLVWLGPFAPATDVTLGQAVETDTAAALGEAKTRTLGQPSGTDTATALVKVKVLGQGLATETDTATPLATRKTLGQGLASETSTAQPIAGAKSKTLGVATETDTAGVFGPPPPSTETYFNDVFPAAGSGGSRDLTGTGDSTKYAMGTHYRPAIDGTVTGVRWFVPTAVAPSNTDFAAGLVKVDPVTGRNGTVTWLDWNTGVTRPGAGDQGTWVTLPLSAPVDVLAGDELYAVVRTNRYAFAGKMFASGFGTSVPNASGDLLTDQDSGPYPNGAFVTGSDATSDPPDWGGSGSFNSTFYGVDLVFAAVGAPTTVTLGQPVETDTAQQLGRQKTRAVGQPAETDTAQPISQRKVSTLGQPAEADTAQLLVKAKAKTLGVAVETDTAQRIGKAKTVGRASETDTASALARAKAKTLGRASEVDTAQRIGKSLSIGVATETDTASRLGKALGLDQATETDTARPVTGSKVLSVGRATETDTATSVGRSRALGVGRAAETDTARPVTVQIIRTVHIGQATETDTASVLGTRKALLLGVAAETDTAGPVDVVSGGSVLVQTVTETDTAQPVGRVKTLAIGRASSADTARPAGRVKSTPLGQPVETDTVPVLGTAKAVVLGRATEIDTARPVSQGARIVQLGLAVETDTAQPLVLTSGRTVLLGRAVETSTAAPFTFARSRTLGIATEHDLAFVFGLSPATPGWTIWDGLHELPLHVTRWTGSDEEAVTVEFVP